MQKSRLTPIARRPVSRSETFSSSRLFTPLSNHDTMTVLVFGVWLLLWGFVGASLVIATTTPPPASAVEFLLQGPGQVYLEGVLTLRQFALLTTIPARWTDVGYAVVAMIPLAIHFLLVGLAADWAAGTSADGPGFVEMIFVVGVPLGILALFGAAALELGAQLLVVSIIALGVGFLTQFFARGIAVLG